MKHTKIIIGGLAFLGVGGLAFALSTKKSTGKAGGALLLADTNSTSLATVLTTTSSGSTDTGTTTPAVVPPVVNNTPFVQYPDGFKWYNANGSVMRNTVKLSLTGADSNILSATVDFVESDGYEINYAIDLGDTGWTKGVPQNITLCADSRVHSLIIGLVHPNGTLKDMHQLFFKVGGSLTIANSIGYPLSFSPSTKLVPQFIEQLPDFTLPNKLNHYAGEKHRKNCGFDFRKRGFVAWELNFEGIQLFDNSLNYQTNYDGWALSRWQNTSGFNQASQAEVESAANEFMHSDGPINKGIFVRDDEWRRGVPHDNNGKMSEYYFFKKCKEISPNTHLFCHHARPYTFPFQFFAGLMNSLEEVAFPLRANYTKDQLINDYVNQNEFGVYWQDIAGQNRGVNAGQFLDISISGYMGGYNDQWKLYVIAQELLINKRFYPESKVCVVIENNIEVSVSHQLGVFASWNYNNGQNGELEVLNPALPASYCESVAILSNFLADGINVWNENSIVQEEHPEIFYSFHSQVGLPEGNTVQGSTDGGYPVQWKGFLDFVDVGLWKYSVLSNLGQATLVEISLDSGESWITGDQLAPALAGYYKRPMAFAIESQGRVVVLAMFPFNKPTRRYDFRVRVNGTVIPVSVCGQYPELFVI